MIFNSFLRCIVCLFVFFPLFYFSFSYFLFYLFFAEKYILLSYNIYRPQFPLTPLLQDSSPYPSFPDLLFLCFHSEKKKQASNRKQPNIAKQDTIRQGKSLYIKVGWGNPTGGKMSQELAECSEIHQLRLLADISYTQANSHNIYTEDLCRPMQASCLQLQSLWAHVSLT